MSGSSNPALAIEIFDGLYFIARQVPDPASPFPWSESYDGDFFSVSRSNDEISLVLRQTARNLQQLPSTADVVQDWKLMRVVGELDFELVGIIAKLSRLLATEKIPIFCVSTFNTDYILVKKKDFQSTLQTFDRNNIPWIHHHA